MRLAFSVATFISLVLLLSLEGSIHYVWSYQGAQGVRFTYQPSYDNFYEGQRFEFICEAGTGAGTNYENALERNKPQRITFTTNHDSFGKLFLGCGYDGDSGDTIVLGNLPKDFHSDGLTEEECGNRDSKLERVIITGNITQSMQSKYSNFSCEVVYETASITRKAEEQLNTIPALKVAPQNLTISHSSDVVEEGKQFNFSCESVGAIPKSNFTYKIQRNSNNELADLEETFYVPKPEDRQGINISCTDNSHINFPGPNIIKWMHVLPQYIEFNGSFGNDRVTTVNLSSILTPTYNLSCDIFRSSSGLRRSWSFNGVKHGEDKETLTLNTSTLKNDDRIVCRASFELGHTVENYTWLFTKSISDSADDLPWIPLASGSVALGAVVIFAIVLVLCCKQKQQRQNRTGNRELPRGNHSRKSKSRTQEGRRRTGLALSPPDQPNQMDATDIANQLLQQQYLHDQELQRLQEELEAKEQILNAAHLRGRELEIFRQQHQQKEAENAFQIDDNYTVFITDPAKEQPSKKKRVKKKLMN